MLNLAVPKPEIPADIALNYKQVRRRIGNYLDRASYLCKDKAGRKYKRDPKAAIMEDILLGRNLSHHKTMKRLLQTCQEQENMGEIIDVRESELCTPGLSVRDNESSTNAIIGRPALASSQK